jgi:hypothetical protein
VAVFLLSGAWFAAGFDFPWLFGTVNFVLAQSIWFAVDIYSDWINRRLTRDSDET